MLTVTSAQLDAWLAAFLFPLARVLALVAALPVLGHQAVPRRVKLLLGIAITVAIAPAIGPIPAIPVFSLEGFAVLAQQVLVGLAMAFAVRVVFAAVELAGELASLQMGLGFASFYDPLASSFSPVVSQFLGMLTALFFLALNGHLVVVSVLAESFGTFPVGGLALGAGGLRTIVLWGGKVFLAGVLLALPVIAALLVTNIALAVLNRASPQLNIFAVGFPLTLAVGFAALALSLPYFTPILDATVAEALRVMLAVAADSRPAP